MKLMPIFGFFVGFFATFTVHATTYGEGQTSMAKSGTIINKAQYIAMDLSGVIPFLTTGECAISPNSGGYFLARRF